MPVDKSPELKRIAARTARILLVAALTAPTALPAIARELAPELQRLLEHFQQNRRVASAYLRTGNVDLGAIELEQLSERWRSDRRAVEAQAAADAPLAAALGETESLIQASLQSVDARDGERALGSIEAAGAPLQAWRKANGIRFFSDCIGEISAAYDALDSHRARPPDFADAALIAAISAQSAQVAQALSACDREAPASVKSDAEFRRLIDGMAASLRQVPQALATRDGDYLHRLLIEQRSYERLLAFRYG
jgi:hypothetical protein